MKKLKALSTSEVLLAFASTSLVVLFAFLAFSPFDFQTRKSDGLVLSEIRRTADALVDYSEEHGNFPAADGSNCAVEATDWANCLVEAEIISKKPQEFGYALGSNEVVIYSELFSSFNKNKCMSGETAYALYSSQDKRTGTVCLAENPTVRHYLFID